jgi:hypothetical protein
VAVGGRRQDAVRGFVVFATKDYFYMLVSQIEGRRADARDFLLQQLNDFYRYIKFLK